MPAETVLQLLPTAAVLLDADDVVRLANTAARVVGMVQGASLDVPSCAAGPRPHDGSRTGDAAGSELPSTSDGFPRRPLSVGARAERLDGGRGRLVVDDLTEAKRVEAVRRDFVANVGHEIKTPVGALAAAGRGGARRARRSGSGAAFRRSDAARGPAAGPAGPGADRPVPAAGRRAAARRRPRSRSTRSSSEAIDRARLVAEAKRIQVVHGGRRRHLVRGEERQLVTAVANLLDNAVAYSPEGTRVVVGGPRSRGRGRDRGHRPGHRHRRGGAGAHLRALLPGRPGALAGHRRHRSRSGDRQAHRRQPRGRGDASGASRAPAARSPYGSRLAPDEPPFRSP